MPPVATPRGESWNDLCQEIALSRPRHALATYADSVLEPLAMVKRRLGRRFLSGALVRLMRALSKRNRYFPSKGTPTACPTMARNSPTVCFFHFYKRPDGIKCRRPCGSALPISLRGCPVPAGTRQSSTRRCAWPGRGRHSMAGSIQPTRWCGGRQH